jgi:hypothetical protein
MYSARLTRGPTRSVFVVSGEAVRGPSRGEPVLDTCSGIDKSKYESLSNDNVGSIQSVGFVGLIRSMAGSVNALNDEFT